MEATIKATQKIEFKIPTLPVNIVTTNGTMPIEFLSEDTIEVIFEAMKQNALEYRNSRQPDDEKKKSDTSKGGSISASGKKLAESLHG